MEEKDLQAMKELVGRINELSRSYYELDDPQVSDAQWDDPLYGQLVFFLPAGAEGPAELVLGEATADASGGACHTVALELP